MTDTDASEASLRGASIATSLEAVLIANSLVVAAKRTRSPQLIVRAERDLQAAVDGARDRGVKWGQIGSTLGIARGNAYQRYRKRRSRNDCPAQRNVAGHGRFVPPL